MTGILAQIVVLLNTLANAVDGMIYIREGLTQGQTVITRDAMQIYDQLNN